jgi:hypothetical protein
MKTCPRCAEKVQPRALICKHCGHQFTQEETRAAINGNTVRGLALSAGIVLGVWACSSMVSGPVTPVADTRPEYQVTPKELVEAYDANEAAAQARFEPYILVVSGIVAGVDLDLTNDPSVKLVSPNRFQQVQANLVDSSKPVAATLQKGAAIKLRCDKVMEVIGTPVLRDCAII